MRSDIEFTTGDGVVLRGWFFRPDGVSADARLPCVILSHGFSAVKEMDLDAFAGRFVTDLPVACLVYDNRGFGASDTGPGQPCLEILPDQQAADLSDAITYAQSRPDVNPDRIALWGSSYSGGHVLRVGAVDRRVTAVLSQAACVDGWANFRRLVRPDIEVGIQAAFQADRLGRAAGEPPAMLAVVAADALTPSALPTADSYAFFSAWQKKSAWQNEVTLRSLEAFRAYNPGAWIERLAPTPLLLTVSARDVVTPADIALDAYARAREPKELNLLPAATSKPTRDRCLSKTSSARSTFYAAIWWGSVAS